ncbi:DedA family protein [Demequina capsici]|uniref:DedA family protein n=1 Tax=Demequina capsici TaxID=3075620 RepID=A0AA96F964_9MICO|nr:MULTISPECIES: DedA family protein [unclassified Demequina]WNM24020.1 DedA family protein [Demequina sp. OYTSA14]WNM26848.1 DedA family protein [Demequina sp. PMTSA13]
MNTALDWILHLSARLNEWILLFAESLWIYPLTFLMALIDGFFPLVPSESIIIATSTASVQTGTPILVLIFVAGAVGGWCGDQIAYFLGSRFDVRNWNLFTRDKPRQSLDWAEHQLERRGTSFIIAARFIPMGRVAVNLTAGALRYPRRRFMTIDAVAVSIWALWSILLGTVAASLFSDNLLVSIVVGVVAGTVLGFFVDKILSLLGFGAPELPDLAADIEERIETGQIEVRPTIRERRAERHGAHPRDGDDE